MSIMFHMHVDSVTELESVIALIRHTCDSTSAGHLVSQLLASFLGFVNVGISLIYVILAAECSLT